MHFSSRDAGTTNCQNISTYRYGDVQYKADIFNEDVVKEISETTDFVSEISVETNAASDNIEIQEQLAGKLTAECIIKSPVVVYISSKG